MTEQQPETQNLIIDGTDAGFMAEVIEPSSTVPVIVDFWAPWCGPCRQLGPALEKLVKRAGGKVKMVKINVDENPAISGQLQVRSIPAVFAFKDGQPVDGFSGSLPESQLQEFIDKLTGEMDVDKEVADLVERANKSFELGDLGGAAQDYAAAIALKEDAPEAISGMIRVYLANDDVLGARNILQSVTEENLQHVAIVGASNAIELAEKVILSGSSEHSRSSVERWDKGIANSSRYLGVFNNIKGNYPQALHYYSKALEINEKINAFRSNCIFFSC